MKTKMITCLTVMVFLCSSFLLLSACAKKQIQVSESVTSPSYDTEKPSISTEEQRKAEIQELEKAKKLEDQISEFETSHIFFDFDSSDLKQESKDNLKEDAAWLNKNASFSIQIEGHCDERGTNEYNLALGDRRAHAAKKFLVSLGVSCDRITTISYGEERPAYPEHNEDAWAKNRRDEINLIK